MTGKEISKKTFEKLNEVLFHSMLKTDYFTSVAPIQSGFQLLDLIIPELKSHMIPYKFKVSHWWKINL